jgi:hypothetical protein
MRQDLMDILLVITCALGIFLTTAWVQTSQQAPVVERLLNIVQQRGHITQEADHLVHDKSWMQHPAALGGQHFGSHQEGWNTPMEPFDGPHVSSRDRLHGYPGR